MVLNTGIPKLDELLNGGFRGKFATLLVSTPGIKNIQFAQQITYSILRQGGRVVYVSIDKKPSLLRSMFKDYEWDISGFEKKKKLIIVDVYSKVLEKDSLREVSEFLLKELKKFKQDVIVIDSLSSVLDVYGTGKYIISEINGWMSVSGNKIALLTEWPYKRTVISPIKSMFNCVIDLKSLEKDIILRNYFTVSKASWIKKLKRQDVLFDIVCPGGVKEYVPKLLVTGPFNSGKSTFTHAISTRSTSVDRLGTTVALDYGHVNYKGYTADVFGTPGQARFDPLLASLGHRAIGLFLVLDSTKPETFARAEEMISVCKASRLPYVVIANKQDLKSALSISQIRKRLSLPKNAKIIPCVSKRKKGVGKALEMLFKEIGG